MGVDGVLIGTIVSLCPDHEFFSMHVFLTNSVSRQLFDMKIPAI